MPSTASAGYETRRGGGFMDAKRLKTDPGVYLSGTKNMADNLVSRLGFAPTELCYPFLRLYRGNWA